jgi:hypothetical protein
LALLLCTLTKFIASLLYLDKRYFRDNPYLFTFFSCNLHIFCCGAYWTVQQERTERAWKDIQQGVRKLLLDDKAWKNNDKGIEKFTQAFYNYYLERQQEEMKEDSGAENKKMQKKETGGRF